MEDHGFNDRLGEKLRDAGEVPQSTRTTARIAAAVVLALIAAGVALGARLWIGN